MPQHRQRVDDDDDTAPSDTAPETALSRLLRSAVSSGLLPRYSDFAYMSEPELGLVLRDEGRRVGEFVHGQYGRDIGGYRRSVWVEDVGRGGLVGWG